jgi:dipeptidyl aminopeptidase/acylaminoacyl peptidase
MPAEGFADELELDARTLAISPDERHLAFHASDEVKAISHQQTDLFVQDLEWAGGRPGVAGAPRNLTGELAYEMGSGVGGDNTAPRGAGRGAIVWTPDSAKMVDVAGSRGSALLVSVDGASGAVQELTAAKQAVLGFAATGDEMVALISNPVMLGDLFKVSEGRAETQLTHVNDALFDQLNLTMPLEIQVKPTVHASEIGDEIIDTFIQLPPSGPPSSLPMILNIHGGPHSAYGWVFDHEIQWMAAQGYVVVYPNPRGSTTYGQRFANVIMNNYPGDDFHDLMDAVDRTVSLGYADPARLGVTGGSGGGLLTDWVVTQTNRFKAAVAQRDIVDWADWWYTADVAGFHQSFYPKAPPFDNLELYRAHSPITYVNNIRTPMMFILGEADYRTPPTGGGEQFFRALKYRKIPTVMVRFPRETHELSRSGEPWHRVERLENILNWFDLYLRDICEPQFDVAPVVGPGCRAEP